MSAGAVPLTSDVRGGAMAVAHVVGGASQTRRSLRRDGPPHRGNGAIEIQTRDRTTALRLDRPELEASGRAASLRVAEPAGERTRRPGSRRGLHGRLAISRTHRPVRAACGACASRSRDSPGARAAWASALTDVIRLVWGVPGRIMDFPFIRTAPTDVVASAGFRRYTLQSRRNLLGARSSSLVPRLRASCYGWGQRWSGVSAGPPLSGP